MSKRPRHSDGSSHSEKKMGIGPQSDESRARRKISYTKEGSSKGHGQSGAAPGFTAQGPGLNRNGPLGCGPSAQGFGPPGCFSSKPKGYGLLGASSLRREQFTTKGPCLLGNGPRGCEPSTNKGPGLLGAGPVGCEPLTAEGAGSAGAGRHRREPSTQQNPRLLQIDPTVKFPVWAGTGPTSKFPGSSGTGTRLLKTGPTTKGPGLMGHGPPTCSSITTPDPRPSTSPSLLGAGPIGHEPFTTKGPSLLGAGPIGHEPFTTQGPSLLGAGPIGHEPFTNYSSQLPSFSPVPFQTLNNNFAQGVSSESAEFRSMDMAPGLEEEPHWKSQIRELKQYIVKLENDKFQMSEQVKKMNNYIVKLQSENSRLIASNECVAGQIFKQHPQQLGERERNLVVEKVYAKLKPQNPSPFEVIESNSNGNSFAPHSIQNQISTDSENKSVNDEDNEIQIIEPVKKELYDPYDHLDLDDLVDLLKNFKELEKSEQESLLTYVKKIENKFPEKARILSAKYRGEM